MNAPPRPHNFAEFWPFYLGEHSHPLNRRLHFVGTSLALTVLLGSLLAGRPMFALGSIVCGYGFAWVGHFFVEKNRPASFRYPLWSFVADWKMWALILTGKLKR